jgi:cation/acetate symporter
MNTTLGQFNLTAVSFFLLFVVASLGITYWAAQKTKSTAEFYTAGGQINGFQNGLALAGDFMPQRSVL